MIASCPKCKNKIPVPNAALKFVLPKVTCPKCQTAFKPPSQQEAEEKTSILEKGSKEPFAWLVVHDQQAAVQTFNLTHGRFIVGRKSQSKPCDVMIDTKDVYMSRNHFIIETVRNGSSFDFCLTDCNSTNHTFLNSQEIRPQALGSAKGIVLKDGDIIQAGQTKIEFKKRTPQTPDAATATEKVTRKEYAKTVLIVQ